MTVSLSNQEVIKSDLEHVFHSWSVQKDLKPLAIQSGKGSYMWDFEGNQYLDFSSQLVNTNIGHQHPKVVAAIKEQADVLTTVAPVHANISRATAAKKILAHANPVFKKVFFTNGGADAIENAVRMARIYSGRKKILSSYRSYHGNTGAAINCTGDWRRIPNEYATGHVHFFSPYLYRTEFSAENEQQETERALHHLRSVIKGEGPESIAAILLESIPGTAGILVPTKEYFQGVRKIADEFNLVMITDEVMAGFGRTGKWFCHENFEYVPDLITFAKGVNSGYVPTGGVLISEKIEQYFNDKMFPGGLTYSGHPLAMATIVATITAMEDEKTIENAAAIGQEVLKGACEKLCHELDIVGQVRGLGVFWAIELVEDKASRTPLNAKAVAQIKANLIANGLLPFVTDNRIHVAPPCNISKEDAVKGMEIISTVLHAYKK